jgi:hypothetical protein
MGDDLAHSFDPPPTDIWHRGQGLRRHSLGDLHSMTRSSASLSRGVIEHHTIATDALGK